MGYKKFCDVCGSEIMSSDFCEYGESYFHNRKSYDLCKQCGDSIESLVKELKAKHTMLREFGKNLAYLRNQKELGDFK